MMEAISNTIVVRNVMTRMLIFFYYFCLNYIPYLIPSHYIKLNIVNLSYLSKIKYFHSSFEQF